jgi:hypothetical protein
LLYKFFSGHAFDPGGAQSETRSAMEVEPIRGHQQDFPALCINRHHWSV